MLAQVVVDVPTRQTNQPYTYAIPEELRQYVVVGMRVVVPFGQGARKVQGFVVGLLTTDLNGFDGELKAISQILDLYPIVNAELLKLSDWLANWTFSFRISILQAMLPNVMRAKYTRYLQLVDEVDDEILYGIFHGQERIIFDENTLTATSLAQLAKLRRNKQVVVTYEVTSKAKVKTESGIQTSLSFEQLEDIKLGLRANAKQQNKLLSYLQTLEPGEVVSQHQLRDRLALSNAVINTAVRQGWASKQPIEIYRQPSKTIVQPDQPKVLHSQQAKALQKIKAASGTPTTFLLEGVTGSGKTEVYLQAIDYELQHGKTALMLVPEISLTPQMMHRVKQRFGTKVAVLHSGLSAGERFDEWRRIERREATVVIGARSAIFAPLENIGIIIMDEEHEASYKQDENPRYHARDVAKWRSAYYNAPLILGSATPSLESRARAQKGVYQLLMLTERINQQALPEVKLIDLRQKIMHAKEQSVADELLVAIKERMAQHEQSVLLLNRRGFSSFVMCRDCGLVVQCPNCDIGLTLHMDTKTLKCHYCGHEEAIPTQCPNCRSKAIKYYGTGTQKVEIELQKLLPTARVIRMDLDTTSKKGAHEKLLKAFGNHEADILLGTQMIAKGLDFPDVTLVGVLNADTGLGIPDFRASERTFQLLTQVAGRAGRADKPGTVFIQTYNPTHYAIKMAQAHDYEKFYRYEMQIRHLAKYAPYYFTIKIQASHADERTAALMMTKIGQWLRQRLTAEVTILGPTPRSIARIKNRFYYQIILKYQNVPIVEQVMQELQLIAQANSRNGMQLIIDREPLNFM